MRTDRRQFLWSAIAAPVAASLARRRQPPAVVGIVGAGLAGLHAADLLRKAGQRVVVLEARGAAGGRVRTVRTFFSDGLFAEAGPTRISGAHGRMLRLVREQGLALLPFAPAVGVPLVSADGMTVRSPEFLGTLGAALGVRPDEAGATGAALLRRYAGDLTALADTAPAADAYARWRVHDRVTWPEWLRSRGASPGAVTLMTLGGDSRRLSALYVLRQLALHANTDQFYKIQGGMDQVPRAMARSLDAAVQYNAAVTRLDLGARGVEVRYLDHRTTKTASFGRVIVAIPFSALRRIEVHPRWPRANASAIMDLPYAPAVRFLLQVKSRFWEQSDLSGSARTDQPAETWDCTYDMPRDRGILGATASGVVGDRVANMNERDAAHAGVDLVSAVFPGMRAEFEKGLATRWGTDQWSHGAFAVFRPGQMTSMMPTIAQPQGRLHFAGEHTSPWMGWMEGALESGERAAREVLAAEAGAASRSADTHLT